MLSPMFLGFNDKSGEKIFSIFKRLHTQVEGTGIGLYIVKKMIGDGGGKEAYFIDGGQTLPPGLKYWKHA